MRALVPMEGAQASLQNLRLSAASRVSPLLRTVPPAITRQATTADYDALVEWSLASIIACDGAVTEGLPTSEDVAHDPTVCQTQTYYLGHEALRRAHLSIQEGSLGLTSSNSIKGTAYIGFHTLVLGRVVVNFFNPFSDGCPSDSWRQRYLKS